MYKKIMVPVDLGHADKLRRSLDVAADLARRYAIPVAYVGVTAATPGPLAHTPAEFGRKLEAFARGEAERHGITAEAVTMVSHDPTTDVDDALIDAVHRCGSDLVVMATHVPGMIDRVWPSNGGRLATHTDASVFLVRG